MLEKIKNNFIKNKKYYITSALAFVLLTNVAFASQSGGMNFDSSSLTGAFDSIISKMGEVLGQIVPKALQIVGVVMIYKFGIKIFHKFSNQA